MSDKRFVATLAAAWVLAAASAPVQAAAAPARPGRRGPTHRRAGEARRDALRQGQGLSGPGPPRHREKRPGPGRPFVGRRNLCITPASDSSRFPIRRWTMRWARPWGNSRASCSWA